MLSGARAQAREIYLLALIPPLKAAAWFASVTSLLGARAHTRTLDALIHASNLLVHPLSNYPHISA